MWRFIILQYILAIRGECGLEYRVNIEAFNYEQQDKLDQRCRFTELKEELGYRLPWDSGSTGVPNCADIDVIYR